MLSHRLLRGFDIVVRYGFVDTAVPVLPPLSSSWLLENLECPIAELIDQDID